MPSVSVCLALFVPCYLLMGMLNEHVAHVGARARGRKVSLEDSLVQLLGWPVVLVMLVGLIRRQRRERRQQGPPGSPHNGDDDKCK